MMTILARYGAIPEVARCSADLPEPLRRGDTVIVRTHRGVESATVLETILPAREPGVASPTPTNAVLRIATKADHEQAKRLASQAREEFAAWEQRIADWGLDLQLIDIELLHDESKWILYVLNDRGPECTKLAIQAAAAGLGVIEVQSVSADGLVTQPSGGGCGSCGCH